VLTGNDVRLLTPELIVVLSATAIYVLGAFLPGRKFWGLVGLAGIVAAGFTLVGQAQSIDPTMINGPLSPDVLGYYVRLMALVVGGVLVLAGSRPQNESLTPEFIGTLMMAVSGVMLVGSARELVMLFLGLELISIPTYVLLFIARRDGASSESAAKYFFLSILSSGLTLYGFSFLYGVGGTTDLAGIRAALEAASLAGGAPIFAQLALVLIFAGLGFKIAAVPFHFYAPDVYQGTTNVNAGVLAVLPKIAGIVGLARVVAIAMPGVEEPAARIALIVALITMTLGNVTALWQNDLRRMFAYSSIAHAGYMLIGLAVDFAADTAKDGADKLQVEGLGAALFYVGVYSAATAGTFAALAYLSRGAKQVDTVDDLAGVGRSHPGIGLAVAVFMFSLAGIPPLAGFWGKLGLFSGAVKVGMADPDNVKLSAWFLVLAIVGVLNAAIAAAYYLRIIGAMYFRDGETNPTPAPGGLGAKLATWACCLIVLGVGLSPRSMAGMSDRAAKEARRRAPAVGAAPAAAAATPAESHHASR